MPRWRGSLHHIIVSDILLKTRSFGVHFCRRKFGNIVNPFYAVRPECYRFRSNNENKGHYAVQGYSRSPILVAIESLCDFLLVMNNNLPRILHRFRDIAFDTFKIAFATPLGFNSPDGGVSLE